MKWFKNLHALYGEIQIQAIHEISSKPDFVKQKPTTAYKSQFSFFAYAEILCIVVIIISLKPAHFQLFIKSYSNIFLIT